MTTTPEIPGLPESELNSDDGTAFDELARRAGAALRRPAPEDGVSVITHRRRRQQALKATVVGGVAVATLIGALVVVSTRDDPDGLRPADSSRPTIPATTLPATTTPAPGTGDGSVFAAAIEASGVLTSPSNEEVAQASDTSLHSPDNGSTQVSASDHFVSLRTCDTSAAMFSGEPLPPCTTGWSYVTGSVDGGEVHSGLLGDADSPEVYVLDDRFFVAMETSPGAQRAPTAWLIDSASGMHAELTWRDEPAIVDSDKQALLIPDGDMSVSRNVLQNASSVVLDIEMLLPRVVDARDGTIRQLAIPEYAVPVPVMQTGNGRIWVGTAPDGDELGPAYSDNGGLTWNQVTLPSKLLWDVDRQSEAASFGDTLLSIAADGDRVAVTDSWSYDDRFVWVSDDAGVSWSSVTVENPSRHNGAFLYVLADKRLLLVQSDDPYAAQLLVSSGSGWTKLEVVDAATETIRRKYVSVNRDGIALMYFPVEVYDDGNIGNNPDAPPIRGHFSTDLTNWRPIEVLDD